MFVVGSGPAVQRIILGPGDRLFEAGEVIVKQFLGIRSGRGRAASRLLPGEPAEPAPTRLPQTAAVLLFLFAASGRPRQGRAIANPSGEQFTYLLVAGLPKV